VVLTSRNDSLKKYRLILLADEPVVELGLKSLIYSDDQFELFTSFSSESQLVAAQPWNDADVLLYRGDDANLNTLRQVLAIAPGFPVILWSREISPELARGAIECGARGILTTTSSPDLLRECLSAVASGHLWVEPRLSMLLLQVRTVRLSPRQSQLLALLVQGSKNKEIASILGISEGTVKAYLTALFEKVGAKDRFELALFGLKTLQRLGTTGVEPYLDVAAQLRSVMLNERSPHPVWARSQVV
jgi:DNA-binding NarL/FixJ family response regulator